MVLLCGVLDFDRQTFPQRSKGGFQLFEARAVLEIEEPVHGGLGNPEPAAQFGFPDAGSSECHVELGFGALQRRQLDQAVFGAAQFGGRGNSLPCSM